MTARRFPWVAVFNAAVLVALFGFMAWVFLMHQHQEPLAFTVASKRSGLVASGKTYVTRYYVTTTAGETLYLGTGSLWHLWQSGSDWKQLQPGHRYQAIVSGRRGVWMGRCIRKIEPAGPQ